MVPMTSSPLSLPSSSLPSPTPVRTAARACVLLVALALAACAGPPDPGLRVAHPGRTAPSANVDWADTSFTGASGLALYAQRWRPATGDVKAVVVIHHGFADHSTRYATFAERLVGQGYAVWTFDMRGHGRSAGARVVIGRIDDFLDDLDIFLGLVRESEPGKPLFVYGHSMGGLITGLYAVERQPDIAGLILAAPAIAFDAPPLQASGVRLIAALAPNAAVLATPHRDFSDLPVVVAEMDSDPLIWQPNSPARTARSALDGAARIWVAPERLLMPLLVVHGTRDAVTAPSGSRDLVARAGAADKTLRLYDGVTHDVLRAPDGAGEHVGADVAAWIDAHAGGPAVTFSSSVPSGSLRGDRHGQAMSVEFDIRGELPRDDALDGPGITGGLRVRLGAGRATPLGIGYLGGLDLRGGSLDGGVYEADAHLAGLALRGRAGALLSVTAGAGIGGVRGAGATRALVEAAAELPAGPLRLLARVGLAWRLGGAGYADDALGLADEASAVAGIRLGRDRHYWSDASAGAGPYLALTYRNLGSAELLGVALGLDLWGGN